MFVRLFVCLWVYWVESGLRTNPVHAGNHLLDQHHRRIHRPRSRTHRSLDHSYCFLCESGSWDDQAYTRFMGSVYSPHIPYPYPSSLPSFSTHHPSHTPPPGAPMPQPAAPPPLLCLGQMLLLQVGQPRLGPPPACRRCRPPPPPLGMKEYLWDMFGADTPKHGNTNATMSNSVPSQDAGNTIVTLSSPLLPSPTLEGIHGPGLY